MLAHFAERSNEKELNAEITLLDTFISFMLVNSSYLMPNFALIALGIEFL